MTKPCNNAAEPAGNDAQEAGGRPRVRRNSQPSMDAGMKVVTIRSHLDANGVPSDVRGHRRPLQPSRGWR